MKALPNIYELVYAELRARKGKWQAIADGSGVPISTVRKIGQRQTTNPTWNNLWAIAQYLEQNK